MSDVKHPDVEVQLTGRDGNAFAILGAVSSALNRAGYGDEVKQYQDEATRGDYNYLLQVSMAWVNVG